ncbi:efflux RND transporter periplasmic adaptor subunit [Shivajiella indica]|uniref:Efflux RND transporter periplasmic adaptor subunit n=1 Tax=Shivajiella indica TaxID=872115 RepID=A0ABW5B9C5_9BACT
MKTNKNIVIIILGCLFFGGVVGWMIRGGEDQSQKIEEQVGEETIWVSPMHPHIRQNEPGNCPICGMELVPLSQFKGSGGTDPNVLEMKPEAVALANIMTTKVISGQASNELQLSGKIQPDEQRVKSIAANFPGRIDKLFVSFTGQEVKNGQKLATVYSPDLVNAQKELLETAKIKDRQPALYQAAKEKLRLWKISDEQIRAIELSGQVKSQFDVIADVSGIVTVRNVSVGDYVNRGGVLFEVVDLSQVWVLMDAYESDLAWLKMGNDLKFRVSAYPGKDFNAKISYIDPMLNPETRTVSVRAEASNPGLQLKPEMFVSAKISSAPSKESGLLVPRSAILWTGPRSVVYVQVGDKESPSFEMREVTLGSRSGDNYIILDGLEEEDEVVSNGVFAVDAAAQLSGNYSMMLRSVNKRVEVSRDFTKQLSNFVKSYLTVKDALVKSDVKAAQEAIPAVKTVLSNIDSELLENSSLQTWKDLLKPIQASLEKLQSLSDLEDQRKHFETLSDNLINAVEYFGVESDTLYRQYCPMAFRDKGAYWLSSEKEIRNPYFGDMMLTCGEVKETYRPVKRTVSQ